MRRTSITAVIGSLALAIGADCACAQDARVHFEIPAGDAMETLQAFHRQSGVSLLYLPEMLREVKTDAILGEWTVREALARMLRGTPLQVEYGTNEEGKAWATIKRLPAADSGPPAVAGAATTGEATERRSLAGDSEGEVIEEVVVTGTLIHGVLDLTSPLQFITKESMKKTPYATVQDALKALPAAFGGGISEDTVGSGNFTLGTAVNLRGLGAGATLVLVNGERQPYSGANADFVDLSLLPTTAIERIEVLPDGASAIYGSDAIAGVVNVIMRRSVKRPETHLRYGVARGGAAERLVAQLFGTRWDLGNALFSYQYEERSALPAAARSYAQNADKRSFGGDDFRSPASSPGNILDPATLQPAYGVPVDANGAVSWSDLEPGRINLQNVYDRVQLLPKREVHNLYVSAEQKLGDHFELSGDLRVSQRDFELLSFAAQQLLVVPRWNPYYVSPFGSSPYVIVGYNFLGELGPGVRAGRAQSYDANLDLKTHVSDTWNLRLSGSWGRMRERYTTYNQIDDLRLRIALADTDPATAFNPFGDGRQNSPALIDAIRSVQSGRTQSVVATAKMLADGTLGRVRSGVVKIAIGAESREEVLEKGLQSVRSLARSVRAAFSEVSVPLVGDPEDARAIPRLELSLSGRFEDYSDFGRAMSPKVGLRWAPMPWLKLRTSWGVSFRAPNLVDVYDTSQDLTVLTSLRDPRSPNGSSILLARQGRNEDLHAERARSWTAGVDLAPEWLTNSALSLTYFSVDYVDRIVIPGAGAPVDILLQEERWPGVVMRDPSEAATSALCRGTQYRGSVDQCLATPVAAIVDFRARNLAATRVNGVDLKVELPLNTRYGVFQWGLDGAYLLNFRQALSVTSPATNLVNTVGNPLALRLRGSAEWFQRRWDQPGWGAGVTMDHVGGYLDRESQPARRVDAMTTLDARLSYRTSFHEGMAGGVELLLNANNVFNSSPPFVNRPVGYDTANFDPYGRVVSISVQKDW